MQANAGIKAFSAEEAVTANKLVKLGTLPTQVLLCDAGETAIGVTLEDCAIDENVSVQLLSGSGAGTIVCTAAGSVTAAAAVYTAADGKVDDTATSTTILGYALATGASNGKLEVLLVPAQAHAGAATSNAGLESTSHENTVTAANFDVVSTVEAGTLVAGDVIEIIGQVWVEDNNSTDTLTLLVTFGTETIATLAALDVADNDLGCFHIWVEVHTAGASGYITALGHTTWGVPGTAVPTWFRKTAAAEDLSADVEVAVNADWSVAHADNECQLSNLIVLRHKVATKA